MKKRISASLAGALATGLLVAGCGSTDDGHGDGLPGVDGGETDDVGASGDEQTGDGDAEEPAQDGSYGDSGEAVDRPEIELPEDMVNVFEETTTGDAATRGRVWVRESEDHEGVWQVAGLGETEEGENAECQR